MNQNKSKTLPSNANGCASGDATAATMKRSRQIFWTPDNRRDFILDARMKPGVGARGARGPYEFRVLPRQSQPLEPTPSREFATSALAKSIHASPQLRMIALKLYDNLTKKIATDPLTRSYARDHVRVVVKGGTAYSLVDPVAFPPSDLDIVVLVDPGLPSALFGVLKTSVTTIALQTISQFKRTLDHMFFPTSSAFDCRDAFLDDGAVDLFKSKLGDALADWTGFGGKEEGVNDIVDSEFISPFHSTQHRNLASKNSFILADSIAEKGAVALIEVPHFERCENIPLRKTPFFVSHNRSLRFERAVNNSAEDLATISGDSPPPTTPAPPPPPSMMADFDLIRLKMNVLLKDNAAAATEQDTPGTADTRPRAGRAVRTVPANFIDISIPGRDDFELASFWTTSGEAAATRPTLVVKDVDGVRVTIPSIGALVRDLDKMLNVYDCPASKQERRMYCHRVLLELKSNEGEM